MPIYHSLGTIPHKRHTRFRKPGGGLYVDLPYSAGDYLVVPPTKTRSATARGAIR